jgi:hypothetical protein
MRLPVLSKSDNTRRFHILSKITNRAESVASLFRNRRSALFLLRNEVCKILVTLLVSYRDTHKEIKVC